MTGELKKCLDRRLVVAELKLQVRQKMHSVILVFMLMWEVAHLSYPVYGVNLSDDS